MASMISGCAVYPPVNQVTTYSPPPSQGLIYDNGYYFPNTKAQPQAQYYQQAQQPNRRDTGGAVLGTLAGGLIGSQVGRGDGNLAATAVGGAIGGVVGSGCRTINGGQILGALAGGIIGSKIGGGSGRQAAVAIGASIGAQTGNDMAGGCLGN
ncbi:glycine zipper 2TM domain-containing protein [archaeon]|nr:glycine zipper 2TM domain-containing protein [archaeon]